MNRFEDTEEEEEQKRKPRPSKRVSRDTTLALDRTTQVFIWIDRIHSRADNSPSRSSSSKNRKRFFFAISGVKTFRKDSRDV